MVFCTKQVLDKCRNFKVKNRLNMIQNTVLNYSNVLQVLYYLLFFSLFCMFVIKFALNYKGDQANVFFSQSSDYMADYFNIAKYSVDLNPYHNTINGLGEKPLLPLTYVIFYLLSRFANYKHLDAFTAGFSTIGLATSAFIMFFISCWFFILLYDLRKGSTFNKAMTVLTMMLSGIFIFTLERGNIVILSAFCSTVFIFYRHSENKIIKEIVFVNLAIAASLKGYPALLGILLLYEKKYYEALRLILYGLFLCFLPFLFLESGFADIKQWMVNVQLNNTEYMFKTYPRFGYLYVLSNWDQLALHNLYISRVTMNRICFIIMHTISILAILFNCNEKVLWKKTALLVCIIILLPVNSGLYCGLYMFPVIVMFFNHQHQSFKNIIYVVLFVMFLNPLQILYNDINLTQACSNGAVFILFSVIFIGCLKNSSSS
jgi:hypothetical protein